MSAVIALVWGLSFLALGALWRRRPHSVLDLWLMVVLCAWLFDIGLAVVLNAGRFDLGFYAGRIYGLLAASFVLVVLLLENGMLYARLVEAHESERRERQRAQRGRGRRDDRQPGQERVPLAHESRAPHAAQRHPRLRAAPGARRPDARATRRGRAHPQGRPASARAHQRGPRSSRESRREILDLAPSQSRPATSSTGRSTSSGRWRPPAASVSRRPSSGMATSWPTVSGSSRCC